jgi:hypothetical protein
MATMYIELNSWHESFDRQAATEMIMRIESKQPTQIGGSKSIPMKQSPPDEMDNTESMERRHYDRATWRMYRRINHYRKYQEANKGTSSSSSGAADMTNPSSSDRRSMKPPPPAIFQDDDIIFELDL